MWSVTGSMATPRIAYSISRLLDGTVLVAGGAESTFFGAAIDSAELYDPTTEMWSLTGIMSSPRVDQKDALLLDGRVLITGGAVMTIGAGLASADIYAPDPAGFTFVVNSTADPGYGVCDPVECTLREAIIHGNANLGLDTITFDIPGLGPHTIQPLSALPTITDPVVIDGTTQPGFAGAPIIELDGTGAGSADGLRIIAGNSTVRGLVINRFGLNGISLESNGSNVIQGNNIGTDVAGAVALGNGENGVQISGGAQFNTIGGTTTGGRNVISGNRIGVHITGSGTDNNIVEGNFIGTDVTGTADLGNAGFGAKIDFGAQFNTIGGTTAGARNIVSGTDQFSGVMISESGTNNNRVSGNYIGTDVTGTQTIGNAGDGVELRGGAQSNTVGGTTTAERNIVSGNNGSGVSIWESGTNNNSVIGNYIGTDVIGTLNLGNQFHGVHISQGAQSNAVGGTTTAERNIISGNDGDGVLITGPSTHSNVVSGNYIGTDVNGTAALGNDSGVIIESGPQSNKIGGTTLGERNIISGNGGDGVGIFGSGTDDNTVSGNYIGTDLTGTIDLGNAGNGVSIESGAQSNTIGGTAPGAGNTIAFNAGDGVAVMSGTGNTIDPNSMFDNVGLGIDLGPDGLTPNDPGDIDVGANNLQNFPDIASAEIDGSGDLVIEYLVDSSIAYSTYPLLIEFFIADGQHQEGQTFLGSDVYASGTAQTSTTANLGNAAALGVIVGDPIVSTATDAVGNTSEFSLPAVQVGPFICGGVVATIVGTNGPEVIPGTPGNDVIMGLGGDDIILGGGGHDRICAGEGNDKVAGGPGNDTVLGEGGDDLMLGADGNDKLLGGDGADTILCGAGSDIAHGGAGSDVAAADCEFQLSIP